MNKFLAGAAVVASLLTSASIHAQTGAARVGIGTLSCQEKAGWGFVFGGSHALRCTFSNGNKVEHYDRSINKFGLDVGYRRAGALIWEVVAPTDHYGAGPLSGHYAGVTAGGTIGVALDANALIG
jgi:hypothetical protein